MLIFNKNRIVTFVCLAFLFVTVMSLLVRFRSSTIQARSIKESATTMSGLPRLILWAWERPEHLNFINPREIGVAFLAETIYLRGDKIVARPRLQPLEVPKGTTLVAVVRIESARDERPSLSESQRTLAVDSLAQVAHLPNIAALQIDFDATQSEREFYRALLSDLRRRIPDKMPLSMTALASWCIFDNWLDNLPVDEAVPMLFEMGVDNRRISDYLNSGGTLRASRCRQSVGVSADEMKVPFSNVSRVYVFSSQPWSEFAVRSVLERSRNETHSP